MKLSRRLARNPKKKILFFGEKVKIYKRKNSTGDTVFDWEVTRRKTRQKKKTGKVDRAKNKALPFRIRVSTST